MVDTEGLNLLWVVPPRATGLKGMRMPAKESLGSCQASKWCSSMATASVLISVFLSSLSDGMWHNSCELK